MVQEISKEVVKQLADKAAAFLEKVTNPPLKELGGLLADHVKFWRYKNQVNIINKVQEFHRQKNISPKQVPIKILAPLLEYCSLEEDEDMQAKWASLLANATDPGFKGSVHPSYIDILNQLTPLEAKILDFLCEDERIVFLQEIYDKFKDTETDFTRQSLDRLVENLRRLNLITYPDPELITPSYIPTTLEQIRIEGFDIQVINDMVYLTSLGKDFVLSCKY